MMKFRKSKKTAEKWTCVHCNYENIELSLSCVICTAARFAPVSIEVEGESDGVNNFGPDADNYLNEMSDEKRLDWSTRQKSGDLNRSSSNVLDDEEDSSLENKISSLFVYDRKRGTELGNENKDQSSDLYSPRKGSFVASSTNGFSIVTSGERPDLTRQPSALIRKYRQSLDKREKLSVETIFENEDSIGRDSLSLTTEKELSSMNIGIKRPSASYKMDNVSIDSESEKLSSGSERQRVALRSSTIVRDTVFSDSKMNKKPVKYISSFRKSKEAQIQTDGFTIKKFLDFLI